MSNSIFAKPKVGYSPWGQIDEKRKLAEGIFRIETASHGGILLDNVHIERISAMFPDFEPFTGDWQWLEEDCDATLAILAFPEAFSKTHVQFAISEVKGNPYFHVPDTFWEGKQGKLLNSI